MRHVHLLLDVDGVLNVPRTHDPVHPFNPDEAVLFQFPRDGMTWPAFPSPRAGAFLCEVAATNWITPHWLTTWGEAANGWLDYAGIHFRRSGWDVLPRPHPPGIGPLWQSWDWKTAAARALFRRYRSAHVVWLEDGFMSDAHAWAREAGSRLVLVDTTPLSPGRERDGHPTLSQQAHDLLYCWPEDETTLAQRAAVRSFLDHLQDVVNGIERSVPA